MEVMQTAEAFCRYIWQKYLVERRYDLLEEVVDQDISVIGTGAHEMSRNSEEFVAKMTCESSEWDGSFIIKRQWYQTTEISDNSSLVIGEIVAREDAKDGILYDLHFRFSMILKKGEKEWKLLHVHQSAPDPNQACDEFFPHRTLENSMQQIIYNLRYDMMTGLLNRTYLKETVSRSMVEKPVGQMLMLDVDRFKQLNDNYGHPFGDKVLVLLAQSLKFSFPQAVIGRVGGDEFVIYMSGIGESSDLETYWVAFKKDWQEGQKSLGLPFYISVSIGVACCAPEGETYEAVWRRADEALYKAKSCGRNQISYQS